jgi:predicted HTH transcriptional regulator
MSTEKKELSKQDKEKQIFAIIANHGKVTLRSVRSVTGFDLKFIETYLTDQVEGGVLIERPTWTNKGDVVKERNWKLKKEMHTQTALQLD